MKTVTRIAALATLLLLIAFSTSAALQRREAAAELTALAAALETNLPEILLFAYERGPVLVDTLIELEAAGEGIAEVSQKAAVCLPFAISAVADGALKVEASVSVSVEVSASASAKSK